MVAESAQFRKAEEDVKKLDKKPGNDEMLKLYGLYKVGKGEDLAEAEKNQKPGMFDMAGKAKRAAWKEQVEAGLSAEDAQKKYVEYVEELKKKHGFSG